MKFTKVFIAAVAAFTLSSCTYVRLTPDGENVAVLTQAEIANCTRQGATTVEVVDRMVVNRNPDNVARDLRILARNRAADRGDAIVPSTRVANGEQTFIIYRCRN